MKERRKYTIVVGFQLEIEEYTSTDAMDEALNVLRYKMYETEARALSVRILAARKVEQVSTPEPFPAITQEVAKDCLPVAVPEPTKDDDFPF
jgi:hypothetical protein